MSSKEAIDLLKQEKIPMMLNGEKTEQLVAAHIKAIEALKKQIPEQLTDAIKNTSGSSGGYIASCPNCHYHILVYRRECHCDKCGQAILWEVEE